MKVYVHTGFEGHWPTGVAAVVVAPDTICAKYDLELSLKECGLMQTIDRGDFTEIDISIPQAIILNDGNY